MVGTFPSIAFVFLRKTLISHFINYQIAGFSISEKQEHQLLITMHLAFKYPKY